MVFSNPALSGLETGATPLWWDAMWTLRLVRWAKPVSQCRHL
jgi:hypothetical protein